MPRGVEDFTAVAPMSDGWCVVAKVGIGFVRWSSCYTKYVERRRCLRSGRIGKGVDAQWIGMIPTMAEQCRVCRWFFGTVRASRGYRCDTNRVRNGVSRMVTAGRFDFGIVDIRRAGFVPTLSR